eukprot:6266694-Ditylum_brightwellii.AAC.1
MGKFSYSAKKQIKSLENENNVVIIQHQSPITFQFHENASALEYYEPVQALAEGFISSIVLVRRRKKG